MGRIPVLLDTDVALPYEDTIDYDSQCVIVKKKDLGRIAKVVKHFHDENTDSQLQSLQAENRAIWLDKFSSTNFYANFSKEMSF